MPRQESSTKSSMVSTLSSLVDSVVVTPPPLPFITCYLPTVSYQQAKWLEEANAYAHYKTFSVVISVLFTLDTFLS